jgi:hypothetical protein
MSFSSSIDQILAAEDLVASCWATLREALSGFGAQRRIACRRRYRGMEYDLRSVLHSSELLALCPTAVAQQHQAQFAYFAEIPRCPTEGAGVIAIH